MRYWFWKIAIAFLLASCATDSSDKRPDLIIQQVSIIDIKTGDIQEATVSVKDGFIQKIVNDPDKLNRALETVDGRGMFLLPGLIDVHVHLAANQDQVADLGVFLKNGVTSVRDMGSNSNLIFKLARGVSDGTLFGPDIYPVGETLNGEQFAGFHRAVSTCEEATLAIEEMKTLGAIQIKVHNALSPKIFKSIIETATVNDLDVVGHIPAGPGPLKACQWGFDEIAHAAALLEAIMWREDSPPPSMLGAIEEMTEENSVALYQCMAANEMAFTPNLSMYEPILANLPPERAAMTERLVSKLAESVSVAKEAGVVILAGTDSNGRDNQIESGVGLHTELRLLVEAAGFSPLEALQAATINPAKHLKLAEQIGAIVEGSEADMIILCSNPLDEIANVSDIRLVIANGEPVHEADMC